MTGNPDPNLHRRAREHGIGEVVIKKAGPQDELRAAVRRAWLAGSGSQPSAPPGTPGDADLAHSLRTPLTALKSAIDILCRAELPAAQGRFAAIAQRNVDQMIVLIERLLERTPTRP